MQHSKVGSRVRACRRKGYVLLAHSSITIMSVKCTCKRCEPVQCFQNVRMLRKNRNVIMMDFVVDCKDSLQTKSHNRVLTIGSIKEVGSSRSFKW